MEGGVDPKLVAVTQAPLADQDSLEADKTDFLWRVKVTTGSRFNAAKRLNRRDALVTLVNAIANVVVIFLSVVLATVKAGETASVMLTLFIILASIALLVTSLFQYAFKDGLCAERMQSCALEISALRHKVRYGVIQTRDELISFVSAYNDIIARHPNHGEADYQRYRNENPDEFKNRAERGLGPGGVTTQQLISSLLIGISAILAIGGTLTIIAVVSGKMAIFPLFR